MRSKTEASPPKKPYNFSFESFFKAVNAAPNSITKQLIIEAHRAYGKTGVAELLQDLTLPYANAVITADPERTQHILNLAQQGHLPKPLQPRLRSKFIKLLDDIKPEAPERKQDHNFHNGGGWANFNKETRREALILIPGMVAGIGGFMLGMKGLFDLGNAYDVLPGYMKDNEAHLEKKRQEFAVKDNKLEERRAEDDKKYPRLKDLNAEFLEERRQRLQAEWLEAYAEFDRANKHYIRQQYYSQDAALFNLLTASALLAIGVRTAWLSWPQDGEPGGASRMERDFEAQDLHYINKALKKHEKIYHALEHSLSFDQSPHAQDNFGSLLYAMTHDLCESTLSEIHAHRHATPGKSKR